MGQLEDEGCTCAVTRRFTADASFEARTARARPHRLTTIRAPTATAPMVVAAGCCLLAIAAPAAVEAAPAAPAAIARSGCGQADEPRWRCCALPACLPTCTQATYIVAWDGCSPGTVARSAQSPVRRAVCSVLDAGCRVLGVGCNVLGAMCWVQCAACSVELIVQS